MRRLAAITVALALTGACGGDATAPLDTAPAELRVLAGDTQFAAVAMPVRTAPTVEVRNAAGEPLAQVTVSFAVSEGGGWVTAATSVTDAGGRATTTWYLGPLPGSGQRLQASVPGQALTASFSASALPLKPDSTYRGRNDYIELTAGSLPLIISAPHGGTVAPAEIPDRTAGETVLDVNTLELAGSIADALRQRTGKRPHLVIARLARTKLDPNREVGEAAGGNELAARAWREWHGFLDAAAAAVESAGGGLYLDVHGHGHALARVELGYLLSPAELALGDAQLDTPALAAQSSVRALAGRSGAGLVGLLRGPTSLGALLEAQGVPAVPSASQPYPGTEPYFTGGYDTERHGSRAGGRVDAIQLEIHRTGARDTEANRSAFAAALTAALREYFPVHYGRALD